MLTEIKKIPDPKVLLYFHKKNILSLFMTLQAQTFEQLNVIYSTLRTAGDQIS